MGKNTTTTWDLTGQVALITGASRGIGAACAESMAHAGAHVIAVARSQSDLESLSERTEGVVEIWVEDIGNSSFRKRVEKLERLDILFNNAGTNSPQPFINLSEDALDEMIQLNVRALFLSAQSAVKVMLSAGNGGSIINMSSLMVDIGAQNRCAYCMT